MNQKNTTTPKTGAAANLIDAIVSLSQPSDNKPAKPTVRGQCAQVLELIRKHQPLLSLELTANYAIPETAARVHDLKALGFNIVTRIVPEVEFRGRIRRGCAFYSIGTPEWPRPELLQTEPVNGCLDLGGAL